MKWLDQKRKSAIGCWWMHICANLKNTWAMGENRLVKRILDIDNKLTKEMSAGERMKLEKQRYDLVEKMIKLKLKKYE